MKCCAREVVARAIKKATASRCRYSIAAIGVDHRGRIIGIKHNRPRFFHKGGGTHAEMALMRSSPKSLKTIFLLRVSPAGNLCPINPCKMCAEKAAELGITIKPVK